MDARNNDYYKVIHKHVYTVFNVLQLIRTLNTFVTERYTIVQVHIGNNFTIEPTHVFSNFRIKTEHFYGPLWLDPDNPWSLTASLLFKREVKKTQSLVYFIRGTLYNIHLEKNLCMN